MADTDPMPTLTVNDARILLRQYAAARARYTEAIDVLWAAGVPMAVIARQAGVGKRAIHQKISRRGKRNA